MTDVQSTKPNPWALISLERIQPSSTNPRTRTESGQMEDLIASVRSHGVLQPILVRPLNGHYEIVAGHRRHQAAVKAELAEIPAVVRELTDTEALEIQLIENLQRADLHPLEEAEGYERLMRLPGYDAEKIAGRIDRSVKYVYDRVKLLNLIEPIRKVFYAGEITPGHAILLARLAPADQKRAMGGTGDYRDRLGGLWQEDVGLFDAGDKGTHRKAVSVRELDSWIHDNVRFDPAQTDAFLMPETAAAVTQASEAAEKIVHITHDHYVRPEARTSQRVFGPQSWKPVKKPCAHAVTGVIVVGEGRGEAMKVCIAKEKCKTHWGDWQKARASRAKQAAQGGGSADDRWKREQAQRAAEQAKEEAARDRWKRATPAILEALAAAVKKAPTKSGGFLVQTILGALTRDDDISSKAAARLVPMGKSAEDLIRHAAFIVLAGEAGNTYWAPKDFPRRARALNIDIPKILDQAAPEKPVQVVQTSAPEASGKKAARKKGTAHAKTA